MVNRPIRFAHVAATSSLVFCLAAFADVRAEEPAKFDARSLEFFERQVRPLLIQRCYDCHGPAAEHPKGGLRMGSRAAFLKGGDTGAAIVPGDPQQSLLVDAINYDEVYQMPPKSKLPDLEIATLTRWVEMGAPWPDVDAPGGPDPNRAFNLEQRRDEHWCWQSVKAVEPPTVQNTNWPKKPLDHFILAKLAAMGLKPAEPADRHALIRRAYFDVIGLPPSPEDIDVFVHDESPQAFEKVVDRLLQSDHFGERWAQHWMDMVRYAETYGHEFDFPLPHAWQYRDYLIRALNANVPYDQFVIEHIAGDLLDNPRRHPTEGYNESIIGTGFWWLGEATHAPVDVLGDEAGRVDNQIDVMSKTFLGLTVACARCHDHKFDAISTKDYYALSGYLKSSRRQEAFLDSGGGIREATEKLLAIKASGDKLLRLAVQKPSEQLEQSVARYLRAAREVMFGKPTSVEEDQIVLADRSVLIHHYEAEDNANDSVGTHNGTAGAGVSYVPSVNAGLGKAFSFSDSTTSTVTTNLPTIPITSDRTIAFWLKQSAPQTGISTAVSQGIGAGAGWEGVNFGFGAFGNTNLKYCCRGTNGATEAVQEIPSYPQTDTDWHHVAVTYNSTSFEHIAYVDGVQSSTFPTPPGSPNENSWINEDLVANQGANLRLGAEHSAGTRTFNGLLDDLRIYDNVLTAGEVAALVSEVNDHSRAIQEAARQFDVDPDRLSRWVAGLNSEVIQQPTHPLNPWLALAHHHGELQPRHFDEQRHRLSDEAKKAAARDEEAMLIANFNGPDFDDWFVTGYAFGDGPTQAGQWDSRQRGFTAARPGVVHSGLLADRHQGVLRSPTFTITHPNIYYHIAGQNAQVRLVMDGYFMVVNDPLLFAGFQFKVDTDGKWIWHRQAADVGRYVGHRAHIEVIDHGDGWLAVDEIRFAEGDLSHTGDNPLAHKVFDNPELSSLDDLANASADIFTESLTRWHNATADAREANLVRWAIRHELLDVDQKFRDQLDGVGKQLAADSTAIPAAKRVLAMADGTGQNRHIYVRGNHRTPGPTAPRQMLVAIAGDSQRPVQHGSGRLEFARKLVDPANPLTSRVMVNRIWHHLFGRGIVASVDNFGVLGQRPSHPELLDYLAGQFVHEVWSLKGMLREIMLSSTYQMSSLPSEKGSQVDPQNLLLHRMPIRRLQGEAIRDAMLAISGRLDRTMYGNSVPLHITSFMQGRGRPENSGPLDGGGRRSLYTEVRRNFLSPMMLAFDTPQPFSSVGRRNVSNVPAQALILMNDPFVVDQAKIWAKRLLADTSHSTEQRIHDMYVAGIGRPPSDPELAETLKFLDRQSHELGLSNDDGSRKDEHVWADLCHVLMNVKAFIFIN